VDVEHLMRLHNENSVFKFLRRRVAYFTHITIASKQLNDRWRSKCDTDFTKHCIVAQWYPSTSSVSCQVLTPSNWKSSSWSVTSQTRNARAPAARAQYWKATTGTFQWASPQYSEPILRVSVGEHFNSAWSVARNSALAATSAASSRWWNEIDLQAGVETRF